MGSEKVVSVHGKPYMTIAGRVQQAHEYSRKDNTLSIQTELLEATMDGVRFKATVITGLGTFTGHAYVDIKAGGIPAQNPTESAESAAIARALGFAGFGVIDEIPSTEDKNNMESVTINSSSKPSTITYKCALCSTPITAAVASFSKKEFGKHLCMIHQDETRKEIKDFNPAEIPSPDVESTEDKAKEEIPF